MEAAAVWRPQLRGLSHGSWHEDAHYVHYANSQTEESEGDCTLCAPVVKERFCSYMSKTFLEREPKNLTTGARGRVREKESAAGGRS